MKVDKFCLMVTSDKETRWITPKADFVEWITKLIRTSAEGFTTGPAPAVEIVMEETRHGDS